MKEDWAIHHLGFIVSDMDKTIEYYKSLGIATVGRELPLMQSANGVKMKWRFAQIGSIVLEFFQPVEGESMQLAFLNKHGEGIQHVGFTVADIDAEIDYLTGKGVKLIFQVDTPTGGRIAFFDTGQIGDVLIELIQATEKDTLADFLKPEE